MESCEQNPGDTFVGSRHGGSENGAQKCEMPPHSKKANTFWTKMDNINLIHGMHFDSEVVTIQGFY